MYKDLEKEYKELMSANAPDLWSKIEMGLEPKQPNAKKMSHIKNMRIWGAAAAAVFCLAVSVPIIFGGRKGSSADGGMTGENMSPLFDNGSADYADVWEQDTFAPTEDDGMLDTEAASGADALMSGIITAKVTEIWEEKGGTALTVEIEGIYSDEAGYMDFSEGDVIDLYDVNDFYKKSYKVIKEGDIYTFEIVVQIDDSGAAEYWIINIR